MIVGLLGGTFDPPHLGHLGLATIALESKLVDQVWLAPCLKHPFGKTPVSFDHRLAMCRLLIKNETNMKITDMDAKLSFPGRTLDLVMMLKVKNPNVILRLLAGTDIYHERDQWHHYEDIAKLAPPIYIERKGVPTIPEPTLAAPPAVSSTLIRQLIEAGNPPASQVPGPVLQYIARKNLYRGED